MTNPKKPRESRKPLDQSFLEFVQGTDPEPGPTARPEPADTVISQLEQDLRALQQRFTQSEQASLNQDPRLSQMEAQLTQITQQVEQMDQNANQPMIKLQQQLNDLEKTLLERDSRHFSQVEQHLIDLAQSVEQLSAKLSNLCVDLQQRFTIAEATPVDPSINHNLAGQAGQQLAPPMPLLDQPEESQQPLTLKHTAEVSQHHTDSDPLLSWISPLLDDF